MPGIYFRRLENKIEIAWDNIFWEKYYIVFNSRRGFCLVSLDVFITNFTDFLYSILDELSQRVNDYRKKEVECMRKKIRILKK